MNATLRHAGYVLRENPVTGFAFALLFLLVLGAALGPSLAPYDPLASDTAASLALRSSSLISRRASASSCFISSWASLMTPPTKEARLGSV